MEAEEEQGVVALVSTDPSLQTQMYNLSTIDG